MKFLSFLFCFGCFLSVASAEPWLASRFSTNCAACHSPGRLNRAPQKRKCTLSCQGCHVNPNGGGIRNSYGKWNSQRWLKSYNVKSWIHGKKTPAPRHMQAYASTYPKPSAPRQKADPRLKKYFREKGQSPLRTTKKGFVTNFADYDKHSDTGWSYNARSDAEFERFLTKVDPYWTEKKEALTSNVETRFLMLSNSGDASTGSSKVGYREDFGMGVMALDLGLRYKPFLDKSWSFVFEHRYLNSPYVTEWNAIFRQGAVRSAYVIYDALPYNTYVMGGIYRPMFGNTNANHRSLRESLAFGQAGFGGSAAVKYEGLSIGSSPNVPFFNLHFLTDSGAENVSLGETGVVANAGLRFVTLGASILVSYWNTETQANQKREMLSVAGGFNLSNRLIANFEFLGFDDESTGGNKGSVTSLEAKYRFFKEFYWSSGYAFSNTNREHGRGNASEIYSGVKLFPVSGLELELLYFLNRNKEEQTASAVETNWNTLQLQAHLYF